MTPLTPEEKQWIAINCQYWQIEPVQVSISPSVHDIAYSDGTVILGKKFLNENPNSFVRRQKLSHELLHHLGFPHGSEMTAIGYYSNPKKDRLSKQLVRDIERWWNMNPYSVDIPRRDYREFVVAMHEAELPATHSMYEIYKRSTINDPVEWYRFFVKSGSLYNPERYGTILVSVILLSIVAMAGHATTV